MKLVSFDVETRGVGVAHALQPNRVRTNEAYVSMCAFSTGDKTSGLKNPDALQLACWLHKCAAEGYTIVCWNAVFDIAWLIAMGLRDAVYANKWLDAMLLYKHTNMTPQQYGDKDGFKGYGLKEAVRKFYPAEADYEKDVIYDSDHPDDLARLFEYNKLDAKHTVTLAHKFWLDLSAEQRRCALLEAACLPMVAEANVEGIVMDAQAATTLSDKLLADANVAMVTLKLLSNCPIDASIVASPTKLRTVLFEHWGLKPLKFTAKGAYSTDKDVLDLLSADDERAGLLHTFREAKNNRTKFADGALKALAYNGDGRVRPWAKVYSTYTGRMTYASKTLKGKDECPTGVALHQWKRDPEYRDLILPPEGYDLLEFDFAGQEFRWMAVKCMDQRMLALCAPGEDAHAYMGSRIGNISYDDMRQRLVSSDAEVKRLRQFGKVANLSCLVAGSPVLTDRGYVPIEDVTVSDKLWDGLEWVRHDGLIFQGFKEVVSYGGITATADHKVLVQGEWVTLEEAAKLGRKIEPALGTGWARQGRSAVRIVVGLVCQTLSTIRRAVCEVPLRVWRGEGSQSPHAGGWAQHVLQKLCGYSTTPSQRQADSGYIGKEAVAEACQRHASTVPEPQRSVVPQLWRAWDRVQVCVSEGWRGLHTICATISQLRGFGHRPQGEQRSLRAGQSAASIAQEQRGQQATYDLLNAGPRARFVVGDCVVSNCQYRTSADTLRNVARVQHKITMTPPQATAIHATYRLAYPRVDRYWKDQVRLVKTQGWVETVAGRRINLGTGDTWGDQDWAKSSAAINFPVQGTGADQKYLALAVLRNALPDYDGHFYYELHDGLFVIVPHAKSEGAGHRLKHMLSNLPYKKAWGVDLPIHFPVDGKRGPSWGKLKEFK